MKRKQKYKKALVILGPTTTGKTEVAFELAKRLDGEVINADKFYLFSGLPLSTGLSSLSRQSKVPSHLYQILEPTADGLPLVDYLLLVKPLIPSILGKGKLPIIEGCSYGYTRALMDLNKLSETLQYGPFIGLRLPNRYQVYDRVERRVDKLFEEGLVSEVKKAVDCGYRYSFPMRKGVIIVPTMELLEGKIDEETAKDKIRIGILEAMHSNLRKFLDVPGINWIEHNPEMLDRTILTIQELL